ncbi:hypothetical protein [Marilutibacter alkalisoli]|uniref:Uncharacterized protein n=1 Tax=Marilutibacter alkalisoli TaxID=2591633 RepID=A0A514BMS1_9GAMM|nr:hypothetical protein [Lysobacter alkalisoli]QDH68694.1 hypothetical protein FKV23_00105 [Lysobacter alkalisoli]
MNDTIELQRLREAHARTEATFSQVRCRAGRGADPDFERRLDHHQRTLRGLLDDDADLASAAISAAKRAMTAADPAAPLMMLEMAREALAHAIRRKFSGVNRHAA